MKKIFIIIFITISFISCGKHNDINSEYKTRAISGTNVYTNISPPLQFEGNYDLVGISDEDCGTSLQVVRSCAGFKVYSNNTETEDFCDINKAENKGTTVTLKENQLKSISIIGKEHRRFFLFKLLPLRPKEPSNITITKILTLNIDGTMTKVTLNDKDIIRCEYVKR